MQLSPIMNIIGAILIVTAIVVHIVCLATPHYATVDGKDVQSKLEEMIKEKFPSGITPPADLMEALKSSMDNMKASINYGLWEMCQHVNMQGMVADRCTIKWTALSKSSSDSFEVPAWIKGAQSMAILGLLAAVATGAMAAVHMFVPSRGDRLRLLPVFTCIGAFVSGAIILCGDIIIAAKYDTIYESILGGMQEPKMLMDFLKTLFSLSWGFALDVVSAALMMLSGLFYVFAGHSARQGGMV